MALYHGSKIVTNGLVFAYDMNPIVDGKPISKSWRGAPTFNASLQDGQNDVSPWNGDGTPTSLGIDSNIRFRGRKVAKFQVGTSRNCYINGAADLYTSTTSTVWTSTFYLKRVDNAPITSVGMYQYITNNTNVNSTVNVTPVENGWYQAVYTRSGLVAGYPSLTGMYNLGSTGDQYYFADWQCENNSFSTPWVSSTRSSTTALLDWTGNNTITVNNLTYNSDGSFSFNGSNSYLSIPDSVNTRFSHTTPWSIQIVYKVNSFVNAYPGLIIKGAASSSGVIIYYQSNGSVLWKHNNTQTVITSHSNNEYVVLCVTFDGTTVRGYKNGVFTNTAGTMSSTDTSNSFMIGRADNYGNQDIYSFSKYNKALSASEVLQNFNALRGRYGL